MSGFHVGPPIPPRGGAQASPASDMMRFLTRVLPPPGQGRFINTHRLYKPAPGQKSSMPGVPHDTVLSAANDLLYWQGQGIRTTGGTPSIDLYICMSLARVHTTRLRTSGTVAKVATRDARNAVALKAFWIDLDVKPGAYPDVHAALSALAVHIKSGALPMFNVAVHSGNGVHCYWVLDTEIAAPQWVPIALALGRHLTALGLKYDSACTVDSVRVLRVPDTFNCKDPANPIPVKLLHYDPADLPLTAITSVLPPIQPGAVAPQGSGTVVNLPAAFQGAAAPGGAPAGPSNFSAGIAVQGSLLADFADVVKTCPALTAIHQRQGAGDSEPLWSQVVFATTFATNGRQWAHDLSRGHAGYTQADTDTKFDQKDASRASKNLGWPSCQSFAQHCTQCATCPMLAFGRSPFQAMRGVHNLDLPDGYYRQNGAIYTDIADKFGNISATCAMPADIRHGALGRINGVNTLSAEIHIPNAKWGVQQLQAPITSLLTWRTSVHDRLSEAMIAYTPDTEPHLRKFVMSFVENLLKTAGPTIQRYGLGWTPMRDPKVEGFAFDGQIHGQNGMSEKAPPIDGLLASRFVAKGNLLEWRAAADPILSLRRVELDAIVAASFAAPLMKFSGQTGAIFGSWSLESGTQKTSAMRVGASVWGHPLETMSKLDDTRNAVVKALGIMRHLPAFWDELHAQKDVESFAQLGFQLTTGTEKRRLTSAAQLQDSGSWATLLIAATNASLRSVMKGGSAALSEGGVARVLEQNVAPSPLPPYTLGMPASFLGRLDQHHGVVGDVYARFLAARGPSTIHAEVNQTILHINNTVKAVSDERFMVAAAATILLGAIYANMLEGGTLFQFDIGKLSAHLCGLITSARERYDEPGAAHVDSPEWTADLLADYIDHCRKHNACLETNTAPTGVGRFNASVQMRMPSDEAQRRLASPVTHIIHDLETLRLKVTPFRKYMRDVRKEPIDVAIKMLEKHAGMKTANRVWGAGTTYRGEQRRVFEMDFAASAGNPLRAAMEPLFHPAFAGANPQATPAPAIPAPPPLGTPVI